MAGHSQRQGETREIGFFKIGSRCNSRSSGGGGYPEGGDGIHCWEEEEAEAEAEGRLLEGPLPPSSGAASSRLSSTGMSSARVAIPRTVVEALHEHMAALCWKSASRYVPKITRTRAGAIIPTSYSVLLCYFSACLMFVSFSYTDLLMLLGPSDVPRGQVGKSAICRSGVCWVDIPPGLRGRRRWLTWREKGAMVLRLKSWRAGHVGDDHGSHPRCAAMYVVAP